MRRNEKGFTLMELMVVIVIVAILAAVAVPLYINYVKDAQRTEAKGAIGAVVTAEQTYYQVHNTYVALPTGFVTPAVPANQAGLNCDLTDVLVNWEVIVTAPAPLDGFIVEATGKTGRPTVGLTQKLTFSRTAAPVWDPN